MSFQNETQMALREKVCIGIGVRLTFVTIDMRPKLWHPVSCLAVFGLSLLETFIKRFQNMVQTVTNVSLTPFSAAAKKSRWLKWHPCKRGDFTVYFLSTNDL